MYDLTIFAEPTTNRNPTYECSIIWQCIKAAPIPLAVLGLGGPDPAPLVQYEVNPQFEQRMDAQPAPFGLLLKAHDHPSINTSNWATNSTMFEAEALRTHRGDGQLRFTAIYCIIIDASV